MNMPSSVIAYGCRYCAPLKRLIPRNALPLNLRRCHHHFRRCHHHFRRRLLLCPSVFPTISASLSFSDLPKSFFTGNSGFSKMEKFVLLLFLMIIAQRLWSSSGINKNKAMVEHLKSYGVISSAKVAEVMEAVDRGLFVPDGSPAYMDSPMPIGYNATISAPHMHGTCLQLLEKNLQPGMLALDVGSGTGYLTACFALMVGPEGRAVGIEHIPELVVSSVQYIKKSAAAPLLEKGSLSVHVGDGRLGWPEFAPYDAIHVGAAAPEIPPELIKQLKPGGRMVIPVGNVFQDLKVIDKKMDGSVSVRSETSVRYVPLTSRDAQLKGM